MSVRRKLFKLHSTLGIAAAVFLMIAALTGAALVFRDQFKPGPPPRAPVVETPLALEVLMEKAVAAGPGDPVTDITLPSGEGDPYKFWLDDDAETIVFLAGDGAVLGTQKNAVWWTRWLFRLHTGEVAGLPGQLLVFVSGLSLAALGVTGVWMVAARRRRPTKET